MLPIIPHTTRLNRSLLESLFGSYQATTLDEFWVGLLALEALLIAGVLGLRALEAVGWKAQKSKASRYS